MVLWVDRHSSISNLNEIQHGLGHQKQFWYSNKSWTHYTKKSVEVVPIITHYFLTQIITKCKLELLNIFWGVVTNVSMSRCGDSVCNLSLSKEENWTMFEGSLGWSWVLGWQELKWVLASKRFLEELLHNNPLPPYQVLGGSEDSTFFKPGKSEEHPG